MVSVKELRKTIEWLRDTTNDNIIYIDKDIKRELGITINDLIRINEIYKLKINKAKEYIKSRARKAGVQLMPREKDLLKILGDKENE